MADPSLLLAFLLATSVFAASPGPGMVYSAAQTLAFGRAAGWMAASGLHLGGYVHVVTAALGLAWVFEAIPTLYTALKLAGGAYLVWLGIAMIRARPHDQTQDPAAHRPGPSTPATFFHSAIVEATNPKTAIFYAAFLPQFTVPDAVLPVWTQLLLLGTIVNVMFSMGDVVSVLTSDRARATVLRTGRTRVWARRLGGGLLITLGVRLATLRS